MLLKYENIHIFLFRTPINSIQAQFCFLRVLVVDLDSNEPKHHVHLLSQESNDTDNIQKD